MTAETAIATAFVPGNVDGHPQFARHVLTHQFKDQGWYHPTSLWCDVVRPDERQAGAPYDPARSLDHLMTVLGETGRDGAALGLDVETLRQACCDLFGPPTPHDHRIWPSNDYVLSTPMSGVFLTVRFREDPFDRFGYGEERSVIAAQVVERDREPGSRPVTEGVHDALRATLACIRDAMRAGSTPGYGPVRGSRAPGVGQEGRDPVSEPAGAVVLR